MIHKTKDASFKNILANNELFACLIRDFIDIEELKGVKPEDISDESGRFVPLDREATDSDTVGSGEWGVGSRGENGRWRRLCESLSNRVLHRLRLALRLLPSPCAYAPRTPFPTPYSLLPTPQPCPFC